MVENGGRASRWWEGRAWPETRQESLSADDPPLRRYLAERDLSGVIGLREEVRSADLSAIEARPEPRARSPRPSSPEVGDEPF